MENGLILKNTAFNVTSMATISSAVAGEFFAIGDGKVILDGTAGQLQDIKKVQFGTRRNDGTLKMSVPITRRTIKNVTYQIYVAPVVGVYTLGSTTAATLPFTAPVGATPGTTATITLLNKSYNHAINTQRISISDTANATDTKLTFYTRLAAKLNGTTPTIANRNLTPFYVVTVTGTGANIMLTITMNNANIDFDGIVLDDLTGIPFVTATAPKPGFGVGTDVVNMEIDWFRNEGKSGYVENSDLWFKAQPDAVGTGTYNIFTLHFEGRNDSPTVSRAAARDTFAIAIPSAASTVITRVGAILAAAFGDAWTGVSPLNNAETGGVLGDNNGTDGTVTTG